MPKSHKKGPKSKQSQFASIDVQPVAIDAVVDRLKRLKQHSGQIEADKLWLDDTEPRSLTAEQIASNNGSTPTIVNVTFASIQRMKATLATLEAISWSLKHVISTVQANTQPALRNRGINSMPHELLSRIFELACNPRTLDHLKISRVCHRFREVALKTPQLWTHITPKQSPEWRNLQVSRSGNSGLIVDFSTHGRRVRTGPYYSSFDDPCTCMGFLAYAMKHAHRWREFTFAVRHWGSTDEPVRAQIEALLENLHAPRLEDLSISKECASESEVFRSWRTPRLQTLQCSHTICPILSTVETSITSLDLTIAGRGQDTSKLDVLGFLLHARLTAVEYLTINVASSIRKDAEETIANMATCFHSLRKLRIDFSSCTANDAIRNVFQHMQMPKLETLSISINVYADVENLDEYYEKSETEELMWDFEGFCEWLGRPLPEFKKRFPLLRSIDMYIEGHKKVDEKKLKKTIIDRLHDGWRRANRVHDRYDFYEVVPEIAMALDARPPPNDDSDY